MAWPFYDEHVERSGKSNNYLHLPTFGFMSLLGSSNILVEEVNKKLAEAYASRGSDLNQSLVITNQILKRCEEANYREGIEKAKIQLGLLINVPKRVFVFRFLTCYAFLNR